MEEKEKDNGLKEFLRREAAREQARKGYRVGWLKLLAFVFFLLILICALLISHF
jgi:hypothetical protein